MTIAELQKMYRNTLLTVTKNQEEIKQREQVSPVEYQNMVSALGASLLLLGGVTAQEKEERLLIKTGDTKFLLPKDDIKRILGEKYEACVHTERLKDEPEGEVLPKPSSIAVPDYMMDTLLSYEEATVDMKPKESQKVERPVVQPVKVDTTPKFQITKDNPDYKELNHFICNLHKVTVVKDGDYDTEVPFVVYPLAYAADKIPVDILVIIYNRGVIKTALSEQRKTVTVEFDGYSFLITGKWMEGKFITQISVDTPARMLEEKQISMNEGIYPDCFGKQKFYEEKELQFFPVAFKNDSATGTIPMVALLMNEKKILATDNELKLHLSLSGQYLELEGYLSIDGFHLNEN